MIASAPKNPSPRWDAAERWLASKVGIDGRDLFAGVTSADSRAERIRAEIIAQDLAEAIVGHRHGKAQTYAEVFAVVYERPLEVVATHNNPPAPTGDTSNA